MIEVTLVGENGVLSSWGWEIALYLFLGGLTAGLMIISGVMRLIRGEKFPRSLLVADIAGFPILALGMLCLLLDLSNKINLWRFYTTIKVQSAMSWGAWILLLAMVVLFARFVSRVPSPKSSKFLGQALFLPPPANEEEAAERAAHKPSRFARFLEWAWKLIDKVAHWIKRNDRLLAWIAIPVGIGIGFYTGVLLSTIPSRPLWNTAILAPLFLVSGLASAGAFLCLFIPQDEHKRLVPISVLFCGIELLLLVAYAINLGSGNGAAERAGTLLLTGVFGWIFWGVVLGTGLLIPAVAEALELAHRPIKFLPSQIPPVLKLIGGVALRFVIVFAGLLSFI